MASFALMIASVTRDRGEVGQEGAEAVDGRAVFGALGWGLSVDAALRFPINGLGQKNPGKFHLRLPRVQQFDFKANEEYFVRARLESEDCLWAAPVW